jgi:hypothetical protein
MNLLAQLSSLTQGASNAVASNVSAPVDGISWLLRKAGLPIPAEPVGGSDWMARQGLTATPQNKLAGLLGETVGMVGPALVQNAAPKIAKGLLSLDDHAMEIARKGIESRMVNGGLLQPATVWHGSPHKFDKFDMNAPKTTGGNFNKHGVSVSDHQSVAQRYADDFGGKNGQLYKVDADIGNPLELSARDFHSLQRLTGEVDHAAKTGKSISESNSVSLEMLLKKNGINWNWQQGEHPIEAIKRAGHDAIKGAGYPSRNGLAEQETLVFNPSLLRILERNGSPIN